MMINIVVEQHNVKYVSVEMAIKGKKNQFFRTIY